MKILFEVKTLHTKEVMRAFSKLYTEMKGARATIRFVILAAIFFTFPKAMHAPREGYIVCWSFGIFTILLAFLRPHLTYLCLLLQDKMYKEAVPIRITFESNLFEVEDLNTYSFKYKSIENLYIDKEHFYLHMEDGDLFIVPKKDFTVGEADDFIGFLEKMTGKKFEAVNLDFKQKMKKMKRQMKQAEVDHDKKLEEKKKSKKKK